jgi:hypothetical protein
MKKIGVLLCVASSFYCGALVAENERSHGSLDLGEELVSPEFEVSRRDSSTLRFSCEKDKVVVRKCSTGAEIVNPADCQGSKASFTKTDFKKILVQQIVNLKPSAYQAPLNRKNVEDLKKKLALDLEGKRKRILLLNGQILTGGVFPEKTKELKKLRDFVNSNEQWEKSADNQLSVTAIESLLNATVEEACKVGLSPDTKLAFDGTRGLEYTLLKGIDPELDFPCGDFERPLDSDPCSGQVKSLNKNFSRIVKTLDGQEVWKGPTGVSYFIPKAGKMFPKDAELACKELGMRLPSPEELKVTDLVRIIPGFTNDWFITSGELDSKWVSNFGGGFSATGGTQGSKVEGKFRTYFDGKNSTNKIFDRDDVGRVICVASAKLF